MKLLELNKTNLLTMGLRRLGRWPKQYSMQQASIKGSSSLKITNTEKEEEEKRTVAQHRLRVYTLVQRDTQMKLHSSSRKHVHIYIGVYQAWVRLSRQTTPLLAPTQTDSRNLVGKAQIALLGNVCSYLFLDGSYTIALKGGFVFSPWRRAEFYFRKLLLALHVICSIWMR